MPKCLDGINPCKMYDPHFSCMAVGSLHPTRDEATMELINNIGLEPKGKKVEGK
jgi:hypothetical protein